MCRGSTQVQSATEVLASLSCWRTVSVPLAAVAFEAGYGRDIRVPVGAAGMSSASTKPVIELPSGLVGIGSSILIALGTGRTSPPQPLHATA